MLDPPAAIEVWSRRHRATYHREKHWLLKKFKRLYLRYPRTPFIVATAALVGAFVSPVFYWISAYFRLSPEEFIDWRNKYNTVVVERAKYGTNLYIPFITKNIAANQSTETDRVFAESKLPPAQGHRLMERLFGE